MAKRSYFEEVNEILSTWESVHSFPVKFDNFIPKKFIGDTFCIGSGGSLCLANLWQNICDSQKIGMAKTLTPYEFYNTKSIPSVVALFSASGRNHDILQVFRLAISKGCKVLVFTTSPSSTLVKLTRSYPEQAYAVFSSQKTPKDGFLAVNSTVAMSCLIMKVSQHLWGEDHNSINPVELAFNDHHKEQKQVGVDGCTYQVITSEWGVPAGYDFEARLAESGLAPCFLTDPRNFGHGRFLWLEKWQNLTRVVIFGTAASKKFFSRFLKVIPKEISVRSIISPLEGQYGAIYCIMRSILLFGDLAKESASDPGKPIVPEWGKKLHRLKYNLDLKDNLSILPNKNNYPALTSSFSNIVLDFDGTIIDTADRFSSTLREDLIGELDRLLAEGIRVGIATGRGSSAYNLLKKQVSKKYHHQVILGLYNGTLIFSLNEEMPASNNDWYLRDKINSLVRELIKGEDKISSRATQISVRAISVKQKKELIKHLEVHLGQHFQYVKMQLSGHSIDLLPHWATKVSVIQALDKENSTSTLCIGDQGQLGGNDEELLRWNPSVSVGKTQPASNNCLWLGRHKDFFESSGTFCVLKNIQKANDVFKFNYNVG